MPEMRGRGASAPEGRRQQGRSRSLTALIWGSALAVAVATVVVASLAGGRSYVVASVVLVACALVPFLASFEQLRPSARELALVAALAALAVASRAAFAWAPGFKPMAAVVMVAGMALGPTAGFVVGALAMLASNFLFGQGPWTPWQMLAFGLCGLAFGLLARRGVVPRAPWSRRARALVAVAGGLFVLLVAGPVLDTSSVFLMLSRLTPEGVLAVYGAGVVPNALHGAATALTLWLAGSPLLAKLARIQRKHGLMEG